MQAHKRQFERRVWGKNGNTHKNDGNDNAQTEYLPLPVNADSQSRLANYTAQGAIPKSRANAERGPIKSVNNVSGGKQQSTVTKQRQGDTRNTINKKANGQKSSRKVGNTNGDINQHHKETIWNESTRDEGANKK